MDNNSGRRRNDANPPDDGSQNKVRRPNSSQGQGETPRSSIAERLVSMWKAGANFPPEFTAEGFDSIKLRELQEKCSAFEKINANLQQKLSAAEGQTMKLQMDLKREESDKKRLMDKMTTIWDYMENITETMNYVTETLDDCKEHSARLESDYNDVILKLSEDNESLKSKADQLTNENRQYVGVTQQLAEKESNLNHQKEQYRVLKTTFENCSKRLQEFNENEKKLQKKIEELEENSIVEKKKMEAMLASEREQLSDICKAHKLELQKFLTEIEEVKKESKKHEDEKIEVFRTLAGKEEEVKAAKQSIDNYKMNVLELQSQLAEKTISCQRANEEKINSEIEIQEYKKQISQISHDLETAKAELSMRSIQLASLEEEKRKLVQELEESRRENEEITKKYLKIEEDLRKQVETFQQKLLDSSLELQTLKAENKSLLLKSKNDFSEIDHLKSELSTSNLHLQEAQKKVADINHKLSLMDSTKEYEVAHMKVELENLTRETHKKISEITEEKKNLELKYDELKRKYDDEQETKTRNRESHSAELEKLDSELSELRRKNVEILREKERINSEFISSIKALDELKELKSSLMKTVEITEGKLKTAEAKVQELEAQNNSSDSKKNEAIKNLKEKLTNAENLSRKHSDSITNLNNKIKQLDKDLRTAKENVREEKEKMANFNVQKDLLRKNERNLEAAERKIVELEKKYCDSQKNEREKVEELRKNLDDANRKIGEFEENLRKIPRKEEEKKWKAMKKGEEQKWKAMLEKEREKNEELRERLEESERRAREYEEKCKDVESQGEELTRKMSEMVNILQEPVALSPSSWKKPSLPEKKVGIAIRSEEMLPPGTVKKLPMQSPSTPKAPKSPGKSILKNPRSSPIPRIKLTTIKPPKSPKTVRLSSPSPNRRSTSKIQEVPDDKPRPLSPDSCTMDIDDDDDPIMREILESLSDNFTRSEPISQEPKPRNAATTEKRFFKSRAPHPK